MAISEVGELERGYKEDTVYSLTDKQPTIKQTLQFH
jgi:hypothetical protein